MKRTLTLFAALVLLAVGAAAQKLSYSAVVRNSANELVANKTLTVGVGIANSATGTAVYSETQTATTNQNGLLTLTIGEGANPQGSLTAVTWPTAFITTTYIIDGAQVTNTVEVNAVPYALYAEKTGSSTTGSTHVSGGNVTVTTPISDFVNNLTDAERAELCAALGCSSGVGGDTPDPGTNPTTFTCGTSTVKDVDNNTYHTVQIGTQCWLKENMRCTHYSQNIPNAPTLTETTVAAPGYATGDDGVIHPVCYYSAPGSENAYNSDPNLVTTYGLLYNWFAAMGGSYEGGSQGICPDGWHVPSKAEFQTMLTAAGLATTDNQLYTPANILTSGTWKLSNNVGAPGNTSETSNVSNFSALSAGGYAGLSTPYSYLGLNKAAVFYTSTVSGSSAASVAPDVLSLEYHKGEVVFTNTPLDWGYSVRCVKDN